MVLVRGVDVVSRSKSERAAVSGSDGRASNVLFSLFFFVFGSFLSRELQCFSGACVLNEVQVGGGLPQSELMTTRGCDGQTLQSLNRIYAQHSTELRHGACGAGCAHVYFAC